jgi:hypothetical protein
MRERSRYHELITRLADAYFALEALHPAVSWAQGAGAQQPLQLLNALLQHACTVEEKVRGDALHAHSPAGTIRECQKAVNARLTN